MIQHDNNYHRVATTSSSSSSTDSIVVVGDNNMNQVHLVEEYNHENIQDDDDRDHRATGVAQQNNFEQQQYHEENQQEHQQQEHQQQEHQQQEQRKTCNNNDCMIRYIFLLLGIGILIPWNVFISSIQYYNHRICYNTMNLISIFAIVFNVSSILTLIILLLSQSTYCSSMHKNSSSSHRRLTTETNHDDDNDNNNIDDDLNNQNNNNNNNNNNHSYWLVYVPLSIYVIAFIIQTMFVLWVPKSSPDQHLSFVSYYGFPIITLICVILCGSCSVLAQSGIVTIATLFPSNISLNQYIKGQSVGGVIVSFANLIASSMEDPIIYHNRYCSNNNNTMITTADNSSSEIVIQYDKDMLIVVEGYSMRKNNNNNNNTSSIHTISRVMKQLMEVKNDDDNHNNMVRSSLGGGTICIPYASIDYGVFIYFLLGTIVLLLCIFGYSYVEQQQKTYNECHNDDQPQEVPRQRQRRRHDDYVPIHYNHDGDGLLVKNDDDSMVVNDGLLCHDNHNNNVVKYENHHDHVKFIAISYGLLEKEKNEMDGIFRITTNNNITNNNTPLPLTAEDEHVIDTITDATTMITTYDVWKIINRPVLCIYITFFITLSLFPGYTSQLRSINQCNSSSRFYNDLYIPFTFVLFNVGDLIGRIIAGYIPSYIISSSSKNLIFVALLRIIFFPLLSLCSTTATSTPTTLTSFLSYSTLLSSASTLPIISSDLYSITIQLLFGMANGLLLSISFMVAPQLLSIWKESNHNNNNHNSNDHQQQAEERMSEMLNLAVSFGLLSGSLFSYPVVQWMMNV